MTGRSGVAPLVGAWIEMAVAGWFPKDYSVAPLVGAWIEIFSPPLNSFSFASLLSWERGLK